MPALYKEYGPQFLAVKNRGILGAYKTLDEALEATLKTEKPGTFLIQKCFESREKALRRTMLPVVPAKMRWQEASV
jgi:hypothetical protein